VFCEEEWAVEVGFNLRPDLFGAKLEQRLWLSELRGIEDENINEQTLLRKVIPHRGDALLDGNITLERNDGAGVFDALEFRRQLRSCLLQYFQTAADKYYRGGRCEEKLFGYRLTDTCSSTRDEKCSTRLA
jgi:hypothetical protein